MKRFGSFATVLLYLFEARVIARLELAKMLGLGGLRHTDSFAVAFATDMTTGEPDSVLLAGDGYANRFQIIDQHFFPPITGAENRQRATVDLLWLAGPAKVVEQRAVTFVADLAD